MSDRTVRAVIVDGATTVQAIAERCAAANRCGGCWPELERLIAEQTARRALDAAAA